MQQEKEVLEKIQNWANENDSVRTVILTSSRVTPNSYADIFSDYDVELYVKGIQKFMNDEWLTFFGDIMIRWPLKPKSTFSQEWITRLVLFENEVRIDFQITSKKSIDPSAYDNGYKVLVDKDRLTENLNKATFSKYVIKKPTKEEYDSLVNDFFWDATYVVKNLWRDEICYAKYILDNIMRFGCLYKMIDWHIAMRHNWSIITNKYGRFFKRYLDPKTWAELQATFSDACIENNWKAFFDMIELFRKLAKNVAKNLGYEYPDKIDQEVTEYFKKVKVTKVE